MLCGSRGSVPSVHVVPKSDEWRTDRWNGVDWKGPGNAPRSCSFCGSSHPGDVALLVEAGWTVERATGKGYKWYISPPSTKGLEAHPGFPIPDWSVAPPVKLYGWHVKDPASSIRRLLHHESQRD